MDIRRYNMTTKNNEKCETCKYCVVNERILFICRRYAPRIIHGMGAEWSDDKFPAVAPDDWCGEYKPENAQQISLTIVNKS
jgi:hypothetical protein